MSNFSIVLGSDNKSPVYNPDGLWQVWNKNDIYLGNAGAGKYIPKVGDEVHSIIGREVTVYLVASIDSVTYIPKLVAQNNAASNSGITTDDILYGTVSGALSDLYRLYYDDTVTPHRLSVDRRFTVGGSTTDYCKIFLGTDTSNTGTVISGIYNQNGVLQTSNISLELVSNTSVIKSVIDTCYTSQVLSNGDIVTLVVYDADGFAVYNTLLAVEATGFIMNTSYSTKFVSSIALDTPFLSTSNIKVINYPINVPLNTMNITGIVNYSDGTSVRKAIDGGSFTIFGLESYSATIPGQSSGLVLKYTLGANEQALDTHLGLTGFISEDYTITTLNSNGHYAVKLFCYPVWSKTSNTYSLVWYLYDLDRRASYNVTPNVVIDTNKGAFVNNSLGTKQTLTVSVNLATVNGSYQQFNHVQIVDVTLNKLGTGRPTDNIPNWTVNPVTSKGSTYGVNTYSTFRINELDHWAFRIAPKCADLAAWLNTMYYSLQPLYDINLETVPMVPTHFQVIVKGNVNEYAINQWNSELTTTNVINNGDTIYIKFITRLTNVDLQLVIAASQAFQVNTNGVYI